ncbi:TPA: hypothetical protein DDZ10_00360 [Candidatus Uhrbacteria bacterium]|nr:hypothetical protein [Candidatus Uhrbacteria bacterium]
MSREQQGSGLEHGREEGESSLDDLDALLASADVAAVEAVRAARAGEIASVEEKKKQSKAAALRAEELQRAYALLSSEDAGVDHVGYEWALQAAEEETGIAAPEGSKEVIARLRKVSDALRRLTAVEPKTEDLEGKIEALRDVREQLFEKARDFAMEALESVKLKYRGEESEFEEKFRVLQASPLTARLEFPPDSPEAREQGMKMEIMELFFRPAAKAMTEWDGETFAMKEKLKPAHEALAHEDASKQANEHASFKALRDAMLALRGSAQLKESDGNYSWMLKRTLTSELEEREGAIQAREEAQRKNLVFFEANRMRVESVLETITSEDELRTALTELRQLVTAWSGNFLEPERMLENVNKMNHPASYRLYDAFVRYGSGFISPTDKKDHISPRRQLAGKITRFNGNTSGWSDEPIPEHRRQKYQREADDMTFANIKRALDKIVPPTPSYHSEDFATLTDKRKAAGWTESKLGALVPPDGNVRALDKQFAATIERLSHPIASAEKAFDIKGEGSELRVYTLGQAKDLLLRARRDARAILVRTVAERDREVAGKERSIEEVQIENRSLAFQLGVVRTRNEELKASGAESETGFTKRLAEVGDEVNKIEKRARVAEGRHEKLLLALQDALGEKKSGLLGGDKALRVRIQAILEAAS